jgi:hypothetical protein
VNKSAAQADRKTETWYTGYDPVATRTPDKNTKPLAERTQHQEKETKKLKRNGAERDHRRRGKPFSLFIRAEQSHTSFHAQLLAHAHERLSQLVHPSARTVSPERVSRLDIHEIGGVGIKKQSAQFAMLPELEVQHIVHLKKSIHPPQSA